ncbi:hypothetical protein [Roseobacter denitrificans]|uniref:hypothetical protein n=1 Tax=Roseobacter denitrificans TaxID=2434 RepID=UPI0008E0B90F|nr:hypothetical protein [Roseobacter denitrificans]SFF77596.1 hypothetical protein SAMN05443635_10279 [Roseobacter denitrificans OCh 114]
MILKTKSLFMSLGVLGALALTGCTPAGYSTSGSLYYDSMMWNDYYYGSYRPGYRPPDRPERPERPDRPNRPERPVRPPGGIDPGFSRPPITNKPIHRPSHRGAGVRGRR